MFARHGIPELVLSDNGPQYASEEFRRFAAEYGFTHVTSSPHYHRANGAAEKGVQTVKRMLMKESDPYLGLLAYRASPQLGLYSPAELLMGRKLRTTVVTHSDDLKPKLPDHGRFRDANDNYKQKMKENHDKGTAAKPLRPVVEGEEVMDRVTKQTGRVMIASDEMSRQMVVQTDKGGELVRNRADVRVMPMSDISKMADEHSISKEAHQKV